VAWYLCSTSRSKPRNWELCKEVGLWAIGTSSRTRLDPRIEVGDHLLFWVGGRGYSAFGVVSELPRPPRDNLEAPWAGGVYAFRTVIPFKLQLEVKTPLWLRFERARQVETDFPSVLFQTGCSLLKDRDASKIVQRLLVQDLELQGELDATSPPATTLRTCQASSSLEGA
jgi:hypothetical protein